MTDYDEMVALFDGAGLGRPPVPLALREAIHQIRPWAFATFDFEPGGLYDFWGAVRWVLEHRDTDSFAVGHEGHGASSYAIGYQMVHGPLVVVSQVAWGGVYMDGARASEAVERVFRATSALIELAPPDDAPNGHLLVLNSDLSGVRASGWVEPGEPADVRAWVQGHEHADPFAAAHAWAVANGRSGR